MTLNIHQPKMSKQMKTIYDVLSSEMICEISTFQICNELTIWPDTEISAWLHDYLHIYLCLGTSQPEELCVVNIQMKICFPEMKLWKGYKTKYSRLTPEVINLIKDYPIC